MNKILVGGKKFRLVSMKYLGSFTTIDKCESFARFLKEKHDMLLENIKIKKLGNAYGLYADVCEYRVKSN